MLNFIIQRPIAVGMTFLSLMLLGLLSLKIVPISLLPDIPIPKISVQVNYPNTSARDLENTVVKPLRNQLLQVKGLKDIHTRTKNNNALIELDFEYGTDTDYAFLEVNEKIDYISSSFPRDMERPKVIKANVSDIPVFHLSVVPKVGDFQTNLELSEFGRRILKSRIEQLETVAFVDMSGYDEPQISVIPNEYSFRSLGMSMQNLENVLQQNNVSLGNMLIKDGQYQYNIQFLSTLKSKKDVENIWINFEDQVLQLKEIAAVQLEAKQKRGTYLFNGKPGIIFTVRKKSEAQLFKLRESFNELIKVFEEDYPMLDFHLTNDQSEILKVSIDNLRTSLIYGALFAFLIMFLFFRGWSFPVLIGIAIPLALVIALLGFYLLGLSINIISLSGLILGVGLMIDNSVIVIENIRQQLQKGLPLLEACAKGTNEVIRPLISSALTTCSVFLPLIFLSGVGGALFYDQAISISIALVTSLIVAYFLLPTLIFLFRKNRNRDQKRDAEKNHLYIRSVDFVFRFKTVFLLFFASLLAVIFLPYQKLPKEGFPKLSKSGIVVKIDWGEAINIGENEKRVGELLMELEELNACAFIGEQQFFMEKERQGIDECKILFFTKNSEETEAHIRKWISNKVPNASLHIEPIKNLFDEIFNASQPPLVIHLKDPLRPEIPVFETVNPFLDFLNERNFNFRKPTLENEFLIKIQKEKAVLYNVSISELHTKLRSLFGQNQVGILKATSEYTPIVIRQKQQNLEEMLGNAFVKNRWGKRISLNALVEVREEKDYKVLTASKSGEALEIPISNYKKGWEKEIQSFLKNEGELVASFSGEIFKDEKTVRELTIILGIAILLLYLILAAQFESLVQPLIVILTVPFGVLGALCSLCFFGESINLVSIIGMIVLSGIVVNDAILKVDMMNKLSRKGHSLMTAIHGAGNRRLKPIIMTTLTTILALIPILLASGLGAELQVPLAISIIGGLIFGTFTSLYFVPLLYWLFSYKKGGSHE